MSASVSSPTKSVTDTIDTVSVDDPLIADRWSNNITYRQLVVSSCIGIMQVWWHPYIHDLQSLLPFLFLYNIFSIFVGYPLFYLELALGVVTKKGVLRCWDLAPVARGVGFAMLFCCVFTALVLGTVSAWCLAMLVHSFHAFLPWLHCAADASHACAARHRPLPRDSETPAQSFFFNYVLNLKRDGLVGGLGNVVTELICYTVICWLLIYFIAFKRIYSYSKVVLFKDVTTYLVLLTFAIGAARLQGAGRMFQDCDWAVLLTNGQMWREAVEYSLIEMTVSQGSLVMLGAYCPKQKQPLGSTVLQAFAVSKTTCMLSALVLGAANGALQADYGNSTQVWSGSSSAMVLWADYVARIPGSQFWSALLFFTMLILSVTSTALLVQTIMSTFTGRSLRNISWVFLIIICVLFCLIAIITLSTQGGLYVLNYIMEWPVSKPRLAIAAIIGFVISYVYGQTTFCEDVYFAVGEYPGVFMRVCWALTPPLLMSFFMMSMGSWPVVDVVTGWILVMLSIVPIIFVMFFYLAFKCRVRNIVRSEK